jgi:hypothetical protein
MMQFLFLKGGRFYSCLCVCVCVCVSLQLSGVGGGRERKGSDCPGQDRATRVQRTTAKEQTEQAGFCLLVCLLTRSAASYND